MMSVASLKKPMESTVLASTGVVLQELQGRALRPLLPVPLCCTTATRTSWPGSVLLSLSGALPAAWQAFGDVKVVAAHAGEPSRRMVMSAGGGEKVTVGGAAVSVQRRPGACPAPTASRPSYLFTRVPHPPPSTHLGRCNLDISCL